MADNEKTVKLREAEIQMEVGKREEEARAAARELGIDLSEMRAVTHEGCEYPEA